MDEQIEFFYNNKLIESFFVYEKKAEQVLIHTPFFVTFSRLLFA